MNFLKNMGVSSGSQRNASLSAPPAIERLEQRMFLSAAAFPELMEMTSPPAAIYASRAVKQAVPNLAGRTYKLAVSVKAHGQALASTVIVTITSQNGKNLSGLVTVSGTTEAFDNATGTFGSKGKFSLKFKNAMGNITLSGTLSSDLSQMSGKFSATANLGSGKFKASGTFVPDLTGRTYNISVTAKVPKMGPVTDAATLVISSQSGSKVSGTLSGAGMSQQFTDATFNFSSPTKFSVKFKEAQGSINLTGNFSPDLSTMSGKFTLTAVISKGHSVKVNGTFVPA